MKLLELTEGSIKKVLDMHDVDGGNKINDSLTKLFYSLNDEANEHDVLIKVAALNQIYATAIQYIAPVAKVIVRELNCSHVKYTLDEYIEKVDFISHAEWVSQKTQKQHSRCNLSFASKYIHFLSGRLVPIYDSYIWIVLIGYLNQHTEERRSYSSPKNYSEFYRVFALFKSVFKLNAYSNYEIDKFLWQYGKSLINDILKENNIGLEKAKSILKRRISEGI